DPVALAGLYAEDGLVLPPAGGSVRGREAIRKFWSNSSRRSLSFNMLQKNVCGETGFFVGTYTARENRSGRFYPASPFVLLGPSRPDRQALADLRKLHPLRAPRRRRPGEGRLRHVDRGLLGRFRSRRPRRRIDRPGPGARKVDAGRLASPRRRGSCSTGGGTW